MVGTSKNPPLRKENVTSFLSTQCLRLRSPKWRFGSNSKFLSKVVDFQIVSPLVFDHVPSKKLKKKRAPEGNLAAPTIHEHFRSENVSFRECNDILLRYFVVGSMYVW